MDVFGGAPRFLAYPRPVVVQSGTDAVLKCQIGGDPRPAVIWERNNEKIDPQGRYRVFEDGNVYNLIISAVTTEDSGQYICKAKNSIGETYAAATLKVEGEAQEMELREENKPRFLIKPLSTRVGRGEDAVFSCKLWGNPRPEVVWEKDGRKLNEIFESTHFSVGYQDGGWFQLKIFKTRAPDGGVYTCKARNEFGEALAGAVLLVDAGPGHEEEGNRNGYTNGHWKAHPGKQRSGRQVPNRLKDDTMTKSTKVKMFAVTEEPPVRFKQPLIDLEVWEQDLAVLECEVPEDSVPITWYLEDRRLQPGAKYGMEEWGTKRRLTIRDIGVDDDGIYLCEMPDGGRSIAEDTRKNPPSGYVLERQEVGTGSQEWLQCLTTDSATSVEILGDSVPCEADYRFRICSVNKYGKSNNVEFPRAVHLVPVARIQAPLQDALVPEGQDGLFSIELSASVIGTWFLNGTQLQEDERYSMRRSRTHQSLRIRGVRDTDNGAEITFIAYGIRDSAALYIQAPLVKFSPLSEMDRNKFVEIGNPIVLYCELSDPAAPVHWYKNGVELQTMEGLHIQSEGTMRRIVIQSAEFSHSGVYCCDAIDDVIRFNVEVEVPPATYLLGPDVEKTKSAEVHSPIVQQFEISDPIARACWYKDGTQIYPKREAEQCHYDDEIADASAQYTVDVKAPPLKFSALSEADQKKTVMAGCPISLQCELSDSTGQVSWYKDGTKILPQNGVDLQSEGNLRSLVVPSAERAHTGIYRSLHVPVKFSELEETDKNKSIQEGSPIVLSCELSHDPSARVDWYKDGEKLLPRNDMETQSDSLTRTLLIHSAEIKHSGTYECSTSYDTITFKVDVKGRSPQIMPIPLSEKYKMIAFGCPVILQCEVSDPVAQVSWVKDGVELFCKTGLDMKRDGTLRKLIIPSAKVSDSGLYSCSLTDDVVTFRVDIEAVPEAERSKSVEAGSLIKLQCEITDPTSQTCWYEDGINLLPKSGINIDSEGNKTTLVMESAASPCSGVYSCKTDDDSDFNDFYVEVKVPPVTFADIPEEDLFKSVVEQEELVLSCEVSRADGVVQWYKDGTEMQPMRIVSPSQSQMELCQQTSERMVLSCEISRPNAVVRWYRDGLEVEENDNLILEVDGVYRRLIIPETTVNDSAEYVCDTADDSMTFFVNIAEPPVRFVRPRKMASRVEKVAGETLILDCEVSRSNAEVTWKKNGEEVEDSRNITILEDGVMRQLTVHSLKLEDAGQYVCDAKDDVMDFHVKVQEMPVKILGKTDAKTEKQFLISDDIILVCELSRSNASVNWYKDDQLIDDTERHCSEEQGVFRSLVVLNAELEDSGEYTCDAVDDKMVFYITVKEPPVQIIGNSGHPEHHILLAGDDLILECEVSRPDATVQWLWNSEILKPDTRIQIDSYDVVRKLVLSGLQPSDSGKYVCDAIDDKLITIVEVQEPSARFVNKVANNHISGYENESVTLCAIVSRERANVRWLKDGQLLNKDNIHISSEGNTHKLTINPLQLSDSGEYVCDVNTDEMYFSLLVKEMSVKFSRPLENTVALRGSSLILRCEINKPKGDVQWLKDGQEISPSRRHTIRAQGRERSFTIHQIMEEDAGEYTCESTDDRTSATVTIEIPRVVEFIAELRNITVCEGEDAVFKCVVSPEDTRLVWRLNGKQVALNERTVISSNGLCHMLCIHNCMVSDSGRVTADAEGLVSETELQVQEQQVLFTNKMTPVVAEEYSEATLEVEVSVDSGEVQWMRQGVLIHPGAKYTLKHNGRKHSLTIHKLAMSDRGIYSCETLHDRTQAQLTVEPRKITIKKGLADLKTTERETASFEVELSHPNVTGTWLRNGVQLKPTNHFRMSAKGHVHSLTISNLSVEDTGTFTFSVENLKTSARLVVKERELLILQALEDLDIQEDQNAVFVCEISVEDVPGEWYKNGEKIQPTSTIKIRQEGTKHFLLMCNVRAEDSGEIKFVGRNVECAAYLEVEELPVSIVKPLQDKTALENSRVLLDCTVSNPRCSIRWYKGINVILPSERFEICSEGCYRKLIIQQVALDDEGTYSVQVGEYTCSAKLTVEAESLLMVRELKDVDVTAPDEACFECEVSVPVLKSPVWSLNGEPLQPSSQVRLEKMGTVHRLTLRQTSTDMNGVVEFTSGKARSRAQLRVLSE
ncbi:Obscurin [Collichthys lucidus]|uniref:Obscurin n=1 Tax=Collichthys lucidus TaxID=240159 RepID=A0A4U5U0T2_COLLU|nr:Obscurin [Collichthys lucidus]